MLGDDFDVLPPDPLLAGSDGDEAPALLNDSRKKWLGVAAGVGVGSAAIAAAMMFWGRKEEPAYAAPVNSGKARKLPIAVASASDSSAD